MPDLDLNVVDDVIEQKDRRIAELRATIDSLSESLREVMTFIPHDSVDHPPHREARRLLDG